MATSRVALRRDLVHRRIELGIGPWAKPAVVVQDPLARTYYHFTPLEHQLLSLADGTRSVEVLCRDAAKIAKPQSLMPQEVMEFLVQAQRLGLLATQIFQDSGTSVRSNRRRWWSNPLAIRLPGVHPERLLRALEPVANVFASVAARWMIGVLGLVAVGITVTQFGTIANQVATSAGNTSSWLALIIAISLMKIVHELAHALTCRRLGGECHEIGVMFLLGVPCLYCDVTDAWLIDRTWKRMAVSAAGMVAECVIAAAATCIWALTIDGPVQHVCLMLMVVGSISTLLINGNPLMRYDGYYLLVDAIGVPNLATQSRRAWLGPLSRWWWLGRDVTESSGAKMQGFLVTYAILSTVYRIVIYSVLLGWAYLWADRQGMGTLAATLIASLVGWMIASIVRPMMVDPPMALRCKKVSRIRALSLTAIVAVGIAGVMMIPLPQTVIGPALVHPLDSQNVSVTSPGFVDEVSIRSGPVAPRRPIVQLRNHDLELAWMEASDRCEILRTRLQALNDQRGSDGSVSAWIPETEEALLETIKQRDFARGELDRLTLRVDHPGHVFSLPRIVATSVDDPMPPGWSGDPLDPEQQNVWIDAGTVLAVVGDPIRREAVLYLPQDQIEKLRPGQAVTLLVQGHRRGDLRGTVTDIAVSPVATIPEALIDTATIDAAAPDAGQRIDDPRYPVRVKLNRAADGLPIRLIGQAKVNVSPASLWARLMRLVGQSFQ